MSLFNIFLENDKTNPEGIKVDLPLDTRVVSWANEFVQKAEAPTTEGDLTHMASGFVDAFLKPGKEKNFQTSIVISKKILDILSEHQDYEGIRIYLCDNKNYDPDDEGNSRNQPANTFLIIPVNSDLEDITAGTEREVKFTKIDGTEEFERVKSDAYFCIDATGCPPRLPSSCRGRAKFL
jgi:hypothetical protein